MQKASRGYAEVIRERGKMSRVRRSFQFSGLMLSELLHDRSHKAIYLGLARKYNNDWLLRLAKDVVSREGVKNRGAYFMRLFQQSAKKPLRVSSHGESEPKRKAKQLHLKLRKKNKTNN
ncbi:MAG: hypothetical protein V1696_03530 [Candidatus Jorgensenbacteria bacterium]